MQAKKVIGVILILIVIVYGISGLKTLSKNSTTTQDGNGQAESTVDYSKLTNKLVYNGQDIGVEIVEVNGNYYLPLLELGTKLNYKIAISDDGTMTISDGINSTVIKSDTTVFINGEEHNKAVNFQPVNSYLVPLDFVRVVLGSEFTYEIDEEKNIKYFYMTGRNIYEVNQNDVNAPHLYVLTSEGLRDLGEISDKKDLTIQAENELTSINSVLRTEKSDIITTNYVYSDVSNYNVLYVRDGALIDNNNLKTTSYVVGGENVSEVPTKYFDNRVAFLNVNEEGATTIKIYDDTTGNLVSEIDTLNQYGGQVYNIQAVAKDFLVVGMFGQLYDDTYNTYYTAVIDLNTNQVIPVYEKFAQAEKLKEIGMQDNSLSVIQSGEVPYDGIVFDFIADDGSLKFSTASEGITPESVNITLSE